MNVAPFKTPSKKLLNYTDVLVFNELEFSLFLGLETSKFLDLDSLKEKITSLDIDDRSSLIVTLGERGLVCYKNSTLDYIAGYPVEAIDTVGSGDCFIGALTFSLLEGKSLKESCKFANKSAAISVTRKGAAASMPTIEEVVNFS